MSGFVIAGLLAALSCSDDEPQKGEILLAIQTDVAIPDSVDRLRVEVSVSGRLVLGSDYEIGPRELLIPATLGILQGADPSAPVLIRVIARKGTTLKMLREVTTTVPTGRVVALRVPIRWLCDDSAKEVSVGQYEERRCPPGQTCIGGDCHDSNVDSSKLPDCAGDPALCPPNGKPSGTCIDVVTCMSGGTAVTVDEASCTIPKPAGDPDKINVALRVADDGVCNADRSQCFVILDRALLDGWRDLGSAIQLPRAVCDRLQNGRILSVVTSVTCATKTEAENVCGCWSSVGSLCTPTSLFDGGPGNEAGADAGPHEVFEPIASPLGFAREAAGGTLLPNGKVLIAGGWNTTDGFLTSAELFDPVSGTFAPTGSMSVAHQWGSRTGERGWPLLKDGRVLVAGGLSSSGVLTAIAEIYNPTTGEFTTTGALGFPAIIFNPVVLDDGKVLFVGGWDDASPASPPSWNFTNDGSNKAQRFDPANGGFSSAGTIAEARLHGCNVPAPGGKVQAVGGWQKPSFAFESAIDEYDPVANAWSHVGDLPPSVNCADAVALPGGKSLLIGTLGLANVYDPATHTVTSVSGGPSDWIPVVAQLPSGDVLAFGGKINGQFTTRAFVYRVASGAWTEIAPLASPLDAPIVAPLPSGALLIAGGTDGTPLKSAFLYRP